VKNHGNTLNENVSSEQLMSAIAGSGDHQQQWERPIAVPYPIICIEDMHALPLQFDGASVYGSAVDGAWL
jgi:hypothetical protein